MSGGFTKYGLYGKPLHFHQDLRENVAHADFVGSFNGLINKLNIQANFAGSSALFFQSPALYINYRPIIGDVDILISDEPIYLNRLEEKLGKTCVCNDWLLLAYERVLSNKIITLWRIPLALTKNYQILQVDFFPTPFASGSPTPFGAFINGAAWDDLARGLKAFHHKYLMQAINVMPEDWNYQILTPIGRESKKEHKSIAAISSKGYRLKFDISDDPRKMTAREIPKEERVWETDLNTILSHYFGKQKQYRKGNDLNSFGGILRMLHHQLDDDEIALTQIIRIREYYSDMLFGVAAQRIDSRSSAMDRNYKEVGLSLFDQCFEQSFRASAAIMKADSLVKMETYYGDN